MFCPPQSAAHRGHRPEHSPSARRTLGGPGSVSLSVGLAGGPSWQRRAVIRPSFYTILRCLSARFSRDRSGSAHINLSGSGWQFGLFEAAVERDLAGSVRAMGWRGVLRLGALTIVLTLGRGPQEQGVSGARPILVAKRGGPARGRAFRAPKDRDIGACAWRTSSASRSPSSSRSSASTTSPWRAMFTRRSPRYARIPSPLAPPPQRCCSLACAASRPPSRGCPPPF
jgi:hypothetical protein